MKHAALSPDSLEALIEARHILAGQRSGAGFARFAKSLPQIDLRLDC